MPHANPDSLERPCPVCGNRTHEHFADERINASQINNFTYSSRKEPEFMCLRLVRCRRCDLVYAPAPPPVEFLSTAYSDAAFDSEQEALAAARNYSNLLSHHVDHLAGRNGAVDVGAGSGPLLPWLSKCGFDPVIGIEPSRAAIDAASSDIRPMLKEGMFSPALLEDIRFSLVCSFMTLEHLPDPGEFIGLAYDSLEPGGMLAVVVHNWRAPLNRILGSRSPIMDVEHLQLFNTRSMRCLLETKGFTSINIQSIGNTYPARYWLRLTPLPSGLKKFIFQLLKCTGLSHTPLSLNVGNMLAVAIKPKEDNND